MNNIDDDKSENQLMDALDQFEAVEANIVKLEKVWDELSELIPSGVSFGEQPEYEDRARSYEALLSALPKIDGWKPTSEPYSLNDIAQNRLDAAELGEISMEVAVDESIGEPGRDLREYRFRFNNQRRALIRDALVELIDQIDADVREFRAELDGVIVLDGLGKEKWTNLKKHVSQVEVLLGSSIPNPPGWSDLRRHIHFGTVGDFDDIEKQDWPAIKEALRKGLYGANEPLPVTVDDLTNLVATKPNGPIVTQLKWDALDDDGYERLIFSLISNEEGYENPEWLMRTRAPDRGRDLSVTRIISDALSGTSRQRVVIQCKHWLSKSVNLPNVSDVKAQMKTWTNPSVDVLIVATSGRFTADAVTWVEQHNSEGVAPAIEMWPESHLERLLAARPALIAEFQLR